MKRRKLNWGLFGALALNFAAWGGIVAVAGCAHKSYELCDTPNCGDPVNIQVEE